MDDVASLGFAIDSQPAVQASQNLDRMAQSAQATQDSVARLVQQNQTLTQNLDQLTAKLIEQRSTIDDLNTRMATMASNADRLNTSVANFHQSSAQMATTVSWWTRLGDAIAYAVSQGNRLGNLMQPTVAGGVIANAYGWTGLYNNNFGEAQLTPDFFARMKAINDFAFNTASTAAHLTSAGGGLHVGGGLGLAGAFGGFGSGAYADPLSYQLFTQSVAGNGLTETANQKIFAHLNQLLYSPAGATGRILAGRLGIDVSGVTSPQDLFSQLNDKLNAIKNPQLRANYARTFYGAFNQGVDQAMRVGDDSNGVRTPSDAETELAGIQQFLYNRQRAHDISVIDLGKDAEKTAMKQLGPLAVRYFDDIAYDRRQPLENDLTSFNFKNIGGDFRNFLGGLGNQIRARYLAYAPKPYLTDDQRVQGFKDMGLPQATEQAPIKSFQEYAFELQQVKNQQQNFFTFGAQQESDYWNKIASEIEKGGQKATQTGIQVEQARTNALKAAIVERKRIAAEDYNFGIQLDAASGNFTNEAVRSHQRLMDMRAHPENYTPEQIRAAQHQDVILSLGTAQRAGAMLIQGATRTSGARSDQAAFAAAFMQSPGMRGRLTHQDFLTVQNSTEQKNAADQVAALRQARDTEVAARRQIGGSAVDAIPGILEDYDARIAHVQMVANTSSLQRSDTEADTRRSSDLSTYGALYGFGIQQQQAQTAVGLQRAQVAFQSGAGSEGAVLSAQGHQAFLSYHQALMQADMEEQNAENLPLSTPGRATQIANAKARAQQMRAVAQAQYQRDSLSSNPTFVGQQNDASFALQARRSGFITNYMRQYAGAPPELRAMYQQIAGQTFDINQRGVPGNLAQQIERIRRTYGNNLTQNVDVETATNQQTIADNQQRVQAAQQGAEAEARVTNELSRQADLRKALNDQQRAAINAAHDLADTISRQNADIVAGRQIHQADLDTQGLLYERGLMGKMPAGAVRYNAQLFGQRQRILDTNASPSVKQRQLSQLYGNSALTQQNDDVLSHLDDVDRAYSGAIHNVQGSFDNFFDSLYNRGSKTWVKLADGLQEALIGALSKLETNLAINPLLEQIMNQLDPTGNLARTAGLSGSSQAVNIGGAGAFGTVIKGIGHLLGFGGGTDVAATVESSMMADQSMAFGYGAGPAAIPYRQGGAWVNGVRFMGLGDIVDRPTRFTDMGGTRSNVMGEAGTEAVMPLTRGPDGALGVKAHSSGGSGGGMIYIDARGADAGVEARIHKAIQQAAPGIQQRATAASIEHVKVLADQGGAFARAVGRRSS